MSPLYLLLFLTAATQSGETTPTPSDHSFQIARILVDELDSFGDPEASPAESEELLESDGDTSEDADLEIETTACDRVEGACEDDDLEALEALEESAQKEIDPERRYTADLSDEELERLWLEDLEALGTISMGFAHAGRVINAIPFPEGDLWTVVNPRAAWTLSEVVDYVVTAIEAVEAEHPGSPKLRVNHISAKDGGPLRPHSSHQNGRDVDLAFYYNTDVRPGFRGRREHLLDPPRNWSLVRALATQADVQVILLDNRIQRVIYNHALSIGEDKEWLDSLFGFRGGTLLRHARRHYDHYHVRFYAPRSQELGRRVQPLLAQRPEENRTVYRVRRGDTLGHIARRYGSSVQAIMRANNMRSTLLRVGRNLVIPLRRPCTICPLPPVVEVPPRRLPPTLTAEVQEIGEGGPETPSEHVNEESVVDVATAVDLTTAADLTTAVEPAAVVERVVERVDETVIETVDAGDGATTADGSALENSESNSDEIDVENDGGEERVGSIESASSVGGDESDPDEKVKRSGEDDEVATLTMED